MSTFLKSCVAATFALVLPITAQAAPFCDTLADTAALPSKYKKKGPFVSDTDSGWIVGADQLKAGFETTDETRALWARIALGFEARGVQLLVLSPPPRPLFASEDLKKDMGDLSGLREGYAAYIAGLRSAGLVAPDLSPLAQDTLAHPFYFARDTHWTPFGAMLSANSLAVAAGLPAPGPVSMAGSYEEKGSLATVIEASCGQRPVPELVVAPEYVSAGASDLLSPSADTAIVLVGSSFSGRYKRDAYRVADALSHAFGTGVDNRSLTGGGMAGSMLAFLDGGGLDTGAVETVVWEVPYTTPLTDIGGLRQVLSLVENRAPSNRVIVHEGSLDDAWLSVKSGFDAEEKAALQIVTPGVDAGVLRVELVDVDGGKHSLSLRKSNRVPGDARTDTWTLALGDLPQNTISRFKLRLRADKGTNNARVYLLN